MSLILGEGRDVFTQPLQERLTQVYAEGQQTASFGFSVGAAKSRKFMPRGYAASSLLHLDPISLSCSKNSTRII